MQEVGFAGLASATLAYTRPRTKAIYSCRIGGSSGEVARRIESTYFSIYSYSCFI